MKNFLILFVLLCTIIIRAQSDDGRWVNGFSKRIAGENLDYHSCHPEANLALLIRCNNDNDYIEWETDSIPRNSNSKFATFVWIAGYSTATSTASHVFHLYLNGKHLFDFNTGRNDPQKDWRIENGSGSVLNFNFIATDPVDDFFGYLRLTVPLSELDGKATARIKIKGDASGSKDWYMTMQYPLVPKINITPERIVSRNGSGKLSQRVRVSINHFDSNVPVKILTDGKAAVEGELKLGMNNFFIGYEVSPAPLNKKIEISINGKSFIRRTVIYPAKKITFYLIPHAHVDIGYTDLQSEVEKKHWQNFDNAVRYSKLSSAYPPGSVFKWNVEVLWAVKSYLENFPDKREDFFDAVKKGWIGLDATYANLMTGLCRPEELYRLFDYSNRLEKEWNVKIESAMISDIPGYTWGMVQALADNGVKYFSVGPNEFDRIGNTLKTWGDKPFYWKSQSGEKKVLVWMAGKGYSWFHHWRLTRDDISPIAKYLDELEAIKYPYDIVHLRYNIGGDNGFPDSSLSDFVKGWNQTHETPKFRIATTAEMFRDLETKFKKRIPEYSGDFTPYWEDGAGSTARETALNRKTAELLTQLETLYTLTDRTNFPANDFDEAWKYLLLFSEHTWGAWNSISDPELRSVKDQWKIKKSYAVKADSIAQRLYDNFAGTNINKGNPVEYLTVWNTSSWPRSDLVSVPAEIRPAGKYILDEAGRQINAQKLSAGETVFIAKDVPPFGFKRFHFVEKDPEQISPFIADRDTNHLLASVLTKETASFIDKTGYGFNQFISTERNAADIKFGGVSSIAVKENGPVINSVLFSSFPPGCNRLTSEVRSFSNLKKIEIINTIDKKKVYDKENIRFAFPFNIESPVNRLDLAWAVIQPEKDQLEGANKNYFTIQRWIDISNKKRGVTLAAIDAPFIEIGGMNAEAWIKQSGQEWAVKSVPSSKIFSWVMNNSWHTNFLAAQEGTASFRYALRTHAEFSFIDSYRFGVEQSQPLIAAYNTPANPGIDFLPEFNEHFNIVVTSVRPAYDRKAILIRLYNPTDKKTGSKLNRNSNPKIKYYISDGDGAEIREINATLKLKPFEAITVKAVIR